MKHANLKSLLLKPMTLVGLCLTFFSYTAIAGRDSYEIYLNSKLIFKQYVAQTSVGLQNLSLDKADPNDKIVIYYSHCGIVGKGRSIAIEDEQGHVLKEWKFADAGDDKGMIILVKDILALKKNNPAANLNLYYFSSKQLPKGRILAAIKLKGKNVAGIPLQKNESLVLATMFTGERI